MNKPTYRFKSFGVAGVLALLLGSALWVACRPPSQLPTTQPCSSAAEQAVPIPYHRQPYVLDSGTQGNAGAEELMVILPTVRVPGAPWLRLHFGDYNLGVQSHILITSLEDGSQQRLDAVSLPQWRNSSAYFNGDAVEVELHVAPDEEEVFVQIRELSVGEWGGEAEVAVLSPPGGLSSQSICGTADNRIRSDDRAVGRIAPIGCTGWIASNGAHLTAGHCVTTGMDILEFNVPASTVTGTIQHPAAKDQYAISSIGWHYDPGSDNTGEDWAIFAVFANPTTGVLPVHAQGAFYRVALPGDMNPSQVSVTGYGVDGPQPCYGDCRQFGCGIPCGNPVPLNSDNQTQQTARGAYVTEVVEGAADVYFTHEVDSQGGNSGSPVISATTTISLAIGIHVQGGCNDPAWGQVNTATSFENDSLAAALGQFWEARSSYVDNRHTALSKSGDILRPWTTVGLAVYFAASPETIYIVTGSYHEAITITKAITLAAPVGLVTIGQ